MTRRFRAAPWALAVLFVIRSHRGQAAQSGQMNMSAAVMETQDELPPDQLPVPQKMTGIGNVHMDITATREAQMWFNQGLNLLHDFWDYESARAFEQAIRVDPKCAMCFWGLYKAESFYHSTAQGYAGRALDQAVALAPHAGKRDRLYIEAAAAERESRKRREDPAASKALTLMRTLVRDDPTDTQSRIFLAQLTDQKESVAILQSILKDKPRDSAANHYFIHSLEPGEHPEQALPSAEILASLAPASAHIVHMPGHIFFRMGDYARAEQAFASAMLVDERYMREQHIQPDNDWNYVHNLMYAITNLMEEGKLKQATGLSAKLTSARGKLESTLYIYSLRDSLTRLSPAMPVALRTGDWELVDRLSQASTPPGRYPNLDFLARQLAIFARGMRAVEARDLAQADTSSTQFDAGLWRMSQQQPRSTSGMQGMSDGNKNAPAVPKLQVSPDALLQPLFSSLSVMSLELRGSLTAARSQTAEARSLFANAAEREKALGYHEPPGYIRPVGETEGAALIAAGNWTEAKAAYERALKERPSSGFALYGIATSLEKSGDFNAAAKAYADFLAAWKDADPELSQLSHARTFIAR